MVVCGDLRKTKIAHLWLLAVERALEKTQGHTGQKATCIGTVEGKDAVVAMINDPPCFGVAGSAHKVILMAIGNLAKKRLVIFEADRIDTVTFTEALTEMSKGFRLCYVQLRRHSIAQG